MNRAPAIAIFLVAGWTIGMTIPGADPYLVLTMAIGGGGLAVASGAVCVSILGWYAESLGADRFGSTIGPLLLVLGLILWIRGKIDWKNGATRAAGFLLASILYHAIVSFVTRAGFARNYDIGGFGWNIAALVVWNAALGFLCAILMDGWLVFASRQRRRKRISL